MERHKEPEAGEALTHFEQQEDEMGDLLLELECPWLVVPALNLLLSPQGQRNLTLAPLPQTTGSLPICPSSSDDPLCTEGKPGTGWDACVCSNPATPFPIGGGGFPPDLSFSGHEMGWLWEWRGIVVSMDTLAPVSGNKSVKEGISEEKRRGAHNEPEGVG